MSYYGYVTHSELYHHGIKGQKWGIRRYENADGTLTEAGKRRYGYNYIKKSHKRNRAANIIGTSSALASAGLGVILAPETAGLSLVPGAFMSGTSVATTSAINRIHEKKIKKAIQNANKEDFSKIKKNKELRSWYGNYIAEREEKERTPEQQKKYEEAVQKYYSQYDKLASDLKNGKINVKEYDELEAKLWKKQQKELGGLR